MTTMALRDTFLSPPPLAAERSIPASLAILASTTDGTTAGTALALACGAPVAVLAIWTGHSGGDSAVGGGQPPRAGFALPPARRLAERLAARGLAAAPRGRLVVVALPGEPGAGRAAAERAQAASGEAPFVLVVAGPRPQDFDPLLAAADRLVVVPPPGAAEGLEVLALAAAARLGRSAGVLRLPATTPTTRLLAATGFVLSPALRRLATAALTDA